MIERRTSANKGDGDVTTLVREPRARWARETLRLPNDGPRAIPPIVPLLLPIVVAAIVTGVLFAWWFPPAAPGTVAAPARFSDVTVASGLSTWNPVATEDAPTTLGGGVVCFDYDGDGHLDLLFVGGAPWPWEDALGKRVNRGSLALFRNDGTGRFSDVTTAAGLNVEIQGMSAAAGDYDSDGRMDFFVTALGVNHLFRNIGRGRFEDVTERSGLSGAENTWSTGACWIDFDNDGKLDLVVAHYARWPADMELRTAFNIADVGHSYGAPAGFIGVFPSVYRNVGDGTFAAIAGGAGLRDADPETGFPKAKAVAVAPVDANADGFIDLLFTYHRAESALFVNNGDGSFRRWDRAGGRRREGVAAGVALSGPLPFAPADGDGRFAALQFAMSERNQQDEGASLTSKLGVALLDYDLDGRVDVFTGNGVAEADTNRFGERRNFESTPGVWWNRGGEWAGAPVADNDTWTGPLIARGVATADFDADGDCDVVIAQNGRGPRMLRNDQKGVAWLQLNLVAKNGVREAYGAQVEVHTPRRVHQQTMLPPMTFMAQSWSTLTFGLSEDARVRRIVVRWPSGQRQEIRSPAVSQRLVIYEP